ncbi:MAG TPA: hypothetical protein VGH74_04670 [Planctomycetaceae bacterium]
MGAGAGAGGGAGAACGVGAGTGWFPLYIVPGAVQLPDEHELQPP